MNEEQLKLLKDLEQKIITNLAADPRAKEHIPKETLIIATKLSIRILSKQPAQVSDFDTLLEFLGLMTILNHLKQNEPTRTEETHSTEA